MNVAINDIYEIAKWFLHTEPMTHKKLQKLLYFSYGIYLAQNNSDSNNLNNFLFKNKFEAWVHGPVDPKIYSLYKNNGVNLLSIESVEKFNFNQEVMNALNKTIEIYGKYSADELENISHSQQPWINARKGLSPIDASNNLLKDEDIFVTFKEILFNESV